MKHRLDIADGYDFEVIGLSSHVRDFKLAWLLSKQFHWELVRETIAVKTSGKGEPHPHTAFRFRNEDHHLQHLVIANRGKEGMLVKKLAQFDFFLFVEGYLDMFERSECINGLRSITEVQLVQDLDASNFEKMQYQLFDT